MASLDGVLKLLTFWNQHNIVRLLRRAHLNFDVSNNYGSLLFSLLTTAQIYTPIEDCERLRALSEAEKNQILRALCEIYPPKERDMEICKVQFLVDPSEPSTTALTDDELIKEIEGQRQLMIAVSTGGPRIQEVNGEYIGRRDRIRSALERHGLRDPNPYTDLWAWYGKWSSGDLPTYQSRRQFISELCAPLVERLRRGLQAQGAEIFVEPTIDYSRQQGLPC